jgi:succinate-semialdehyde dehydrogenase/glutarate-semialdehyde dehydrogenase
VTSSRPEGEAPAAAAESRDCTWFPTKLWIAGAWREAESGRTFAVSDPATAEPLAEVPLAGEAETRSAVEAAQAAFGPWRSRSATQRADVLWAIRERLLANRERLAQLRTAEQGGPLAQSREEVDFAAGFFRWFAEEARRIYGRTIPHPDPRRRLRVEYAPVGVVGAITPWNAPVSAAARKVAAALAAGCTVVLKPSELTPLSALALAWVADQAGLPSGALNVVCGDAPAVGRALLEHDAVRMITFTGSVRTGTYLTSEAGRRLKRVAMELGGNAPFVVFADADLEQAAEDLVALKCANSGQVCVAANRVLVERSVQARFVEMLERRLQQQRLGHGRDPETTMGPLISAEAARRVAALVDEARAQGARLVCGGVPAPGLGEHFYPPTLLDDVTPSMRIAREEIFGPVLPVLAFDGEEEAIRAANDTLYGLAAYVYTSDLDRAHRCAENLRAGVVGINDPRPITPEAPFGGVGLSGMGREGGIEGLLEFLDARLIGVRLPGPGSGGARGGR